MSIFKSPKKQNLGAQIPIDAIQQGFIDGCAKWPPESPTAAHVEVLGYVDAPDQDCYSRDIGRSFHLAGRTYYIFGDTFCNDAGISSNTVQVVPDRSRPKDAYYLDKDSNGRVPPLIDMNSDEVKYLKYPGNEGKRYAFWCFGGVVEVTPGIGWTWYQKHLFSSGGQGELIGVGIARISHDKDDSTGRLSCARMPGLMFEQHQPLFGSFSTLVEGDTVYLWGQKGTDVFLARVPKENCQQLHRYTFWNGREYVDQMHMAVPVLRDFQQGQIFKSELFGPGLPWVLIGVTRWADSMVMVSAASRIEGPWDVRPLFQARGIKTPDTYQYCAYPHPWGANAQDNQLLVSWCDHWPGGVILANVRLDSHPRTHWATIALDSCTEQAAHSVANRATEICHAGDVQYAEFSNPRSLRLWSTDERALRSGLNMIRLRMVSANKEEAEKTQEDRPRGYSFSGFLAKVLGRGCTE
ncbi:MAG: hypothetical protein L6R39_001734 [Caloplaca ligustica]|nr:MAG: hypothetical protein L6R39_001734 [Caloplaca ligustica]